MNNSISTKIDLNLLKVLKVLGEEKSASRTAGKMSVSQPSISQSLRKLRALFNDDLFIRKPYGLEPTPYCEDILSQLPLLFNEVDNIFNPLAEHDSVVYRGIINIAVNSSIISAVHKVIFPKLRASSPHTEFRFVNWSWDTETKIQQGDIDLGINFSDLDLSIKTRSSPLYSSEFGLCYSPKKIQFTEECVPFEVLNNYPIILTIMPNFASYSSYTEKMLIERNIAPNILFRSEQIECCFNVLKSDKAVMPVSRFIENSLPNDIEFISIERDMTHPNGDISAYYSHAKRNHPKSKWLLESIKQLFKEI